MIIHALAIVTDILCDIDKEPPVSYISQRDFRVVFPSHISWNVVKMLMQMVLKRANLNCSKAKLMYFKQFYKSSF